MKVSILSILFTELVFSQNLPLVCDNVSPNNPPSLVGCVNGTEEFFNTEFPEDFFNEQCLCCTPGTDDNPPDNCFFDQTINSFEGRIICSENFDCCNCGAIICSDCKEIICNGDQGCLGVDPIIINGGSNGAILACNGDISCFRTVVNGEFVTDIACNGDISCGNSTFTLNQDPITDVEPLGGMGLGFTGDKSGNAIIVTANGVSNLGCAGDDSCPESYLNLDCISIGCPLIVNGDRAATKATWIVNGGNLLDTNGDNSVSFTTFTINMISSGGALTVTGDDAALLSTWVVTNANRLSCVGDGACVKTDFNINFIPNNINNKVEVAGPNGAFMSNWDLTYPSDILCGNNAACQMIRLKASCISSGCPFTCKGIDACEESTVNITSVSNIQCTSANACSNSVLGIDCIGTGCPITCAGACKDSTFDIVNSKGLTCNQQIPIVNPITEVIIGFEGTCENSVFHLSNNVGGAIICNGFEACENTVIKDSLGGVVHNLNAVGTIKGLMCSGERACYGAEILGECNDMNQGCPLMCQGADACSNGGTSRIIKLIGASSVLCVSGTIGTISKPGCGDRTFEIAPANQPNFGFACSGSIACKNGIYNINGQSAGSSLTLKDVKCDATSACENAQFNFLPELNQPISITDKFGCSAQSACENTTISFNLQNINDAITISLLECTSVDACKNTMISILLNDVLLSEAQINSKISAGTLNINILCAQLSFCDGAKFTGTTITFASISSAFNALFPNAEKPKLINQLGAVWIIIIGILIVVVILLVRKNYLYKKLEKTMVHSIKHEKSNKTDKRINEGNKSGETNENKKDTEIKYSDNTKDII